MAAAEEIKSKQEQGQAADVSNTCFSEKRAGEGMPRPHEPPSDGFQISGSTG
jgi:hypothetical protein